METANAMDDDPFQKVLDRMQAVCTAGFNRMRGLWSEMFDDDVCLDYTVRLPEHMTAFFEEVYDESFQRKQRLEADIVQLKQEALDLQRLLGCEQPTTTTTTTTLPATGPSRCVPLMEQRTALDASLVQMREMLAERHEIIDQYLLEMETLCEELTEKPLQLTKDPLPTERELSDVRSFLDHLMAEKLARLDEIANLRRETKKLMAHLETIPLSNDQDDLLNARKFPPTRANMQALRLLHSNMTAQYESLRQHIDDTRHKLDRLWSCLQTEPAVMKKFQKLTAYTQTTFDKLFAELDRCETLRRENMKSFIDRTRSEIREWWERCMKSDAERARFSTFHSSDYNEDTLKLHELELESLQEFYRENEPLFQMVHQRQEMWDRMVALENKSNDPSRYNNRGGKLLEEEKERRRISNQLPKIEAKLVEACKRYEEENGRKFTVYGQGLEELIEQQWKERVESKHLISSARKKAAGGGGTAALGTSSIGRTPNRNGESMMKCSSIMSANRSRLVGSAMKAPMTPASACKSGPWLKRKLATTPSSAVGMSHAKRSLLREMNSPAVGGGVGGREMNRTAGTRTMVASGGGVRVAPGKVPAVKVYDSKAGGSVAQKRHSRRKSQNKRRSVSKAAVPSVIVSSADGTVLQESVCYENIENFFENNVPNRSSVVPDKHRSRRTSGRLQQQRMQPMKLLLPEGSFSEEAGEENVEPASTTTTTTATVPMSFPHSPAASSTLLLRSPGHSTTLAGGGNTTRGGSRRLKPAAKNCPIIF